MKGTTSTTLKILIERLNWPIPLVRWQAAREFAGLFSNKDCGEQAAVVFFEWLSTRHLESQVISGLAILLCMKEGELLPFDVVVSFIKKPSILTDMMLESIYGFGKTQGGWEHAYAGAVPKTFASGPYFRPNIKTQTQPILENEFVALEEEVGLPFMRQWAFEWQNIMDNNKGAYSSYPDHFMGSMRDNNIYGQFHQAQGDIYRSSYLRTLAHAVFVWGMPLDRAQELALYNLPLNRKLSMLRPIQRPEWLLDIPEQFCGEGVDMKALALKLIKHPACNANMRIANIKVPLNPTISEFGELTISSVLASDDYVHPDLEFTPLGMAWQLDDQISFEGAMQERGIRRFTKRGEKGFCVPLCLDAIPIASGRWQGDYLSAGISLPAPYNFSAPPVVTCNENGVVLHDKGTLAGQWAVWHDHWTPLYAKGGSTRCGIITEMARYAIEYAQATHRLRLGWVVQLRFWSQNKAHRDFELLRKSDFFYDS